jgi:predicted nucleotidyltransferase
VFPSVPSQTDALTLDEVVARLAAQETVMGIVLIGSTADHTLTAASDYDLLLIGLKQTFVSPSAIRNGYC